jgi:SpoIID/LytB domain protein
MEHSRAPLIEVGILKHDRVRFRLEGNYMISRGEMWPAGETVASVQEGKIRITHAGKLIREGSVMLLDPEDLEVGRFLLHDVVIGVGFHWEQKEVQEFRGSLKLMIEEEQIRVVNIISLEEYLVSVISSEMRGDSSLELLKAHTIISRSWLLAQIDKQKALLEADLSYVQVQQKEGEYIRWYDREDHSGFHVCADDHCQRYQGITRAYNPKVEQAVKQTTGLVLTYGGKICDARFSKCCGGVSEKFESCWENVSHPYLRRVDDNPAAAPVNVTDLKIESNAEQFIKDSPDAFCNTSDPRLLRQVLNDYDQASADFYRWEVTYGQEELKSLIREKSGLDFGEIRDMVPVERGESARLIRLKIVGTRRELIIGKELEIRRWLSTSHLYSSAFTIERMEVSGGIPRRFILRGAGWGHGVGLCQIGAAVMADRGRSHREILEHYFVNTKLENRYA